MSEEFTNKLRELKVPDGRIKLIESFIQQKHAEINVEIPKMEEIYIKTLSDIPTEFRNMPEDDFFCLVENCAFVEIKEHAPPEPGKISDVLYFGMFPEVDYGKKDETNCDLVGLLKEGAGYSIPCIITASKRRGYDNISKLDTLQMMRAYRTELGYFKKQHPTFVAAYLHQNTLFNESTATESAITQKELENKILGAYRKVPGLARVSSNLSSLIPDAKRKKPQVNRTDLRVIMAVIEKVMFGRTKKTMNPYCRLGVSDTSTQDSSPFTVWANPRIVKAVDAGEKSFVNIIGTLEHNNEKNQYYMNACNIFPIKKVPLMPIATDLGGNQGIQRGEQPMINICL